MHVAILSPVVDSAIHMAHNFTETDPQLFQLSKITV